VPLVVKEGTTKGSDEVRVPAVSVIGEFPSVEVPIHSARAPGVLAQVVAYDPAG
jgi:hypothetical protein